MDQKTNVFIAKFHEIWSKDQKKGLHLKICADFHEFWGEDKKKTLHLQKCANFHEFRDETTKKRFFITKSAKKQFLLTNFGVIINILGVSGIELHSSGTDPITFLGAQSSLGGIILVWGHKQCFGGAQPRNAPVALDLLQVYSNLSNCNYRIFVKEMLHEIGFIEEMRTIWGNKEVPQTFFPQFPLFAKYDLIRLTPYHCQPCIRNFVTLQKV